MNYQLYTLQVITAGRSLILSRRGSGVIENVASAAFSDVSGEQYEEWGNGRQGE